LHKSEELDRIFRRLLEPARQAASLAPDPSSGGEDKESGFYRLWYHGPSGNELVVWLSEPEHRVVALQLRWLGKWVFREYGRPAEAGHLPDPHPPLSGRRLFATQMFAPPNEPEGRLLAQAAQVLGALPMPLPGPLLWQFLETGEQVYLPSLVVQRVA
jgi:hypothetical protein